MEIPRHWPPTRSSGAIPKREIFPRSYPLPISHDEPFEGLPLGPGELEVRFTMFDPTLEGMT